MFANQEAALLPGPPLSLLDPAPKTRIGVFEADPSLEHGLTELERTVQNLSFLVHFTFL